jgi:hypothetical protein
VPKSSQHREPRVVVAGVEIAAPMARSLAITGSLPPSAMSAAQGMATFSSFLGDHGQ